jgi:hypothetical protein
MIPCQIQPILKARRRSSRPILQRKILKTLLRNKAKNKKKIFQRTKYRQHGTEKRLFQVDDLSPNMEENERVDAAECISCGYCGVKLCHSASWCSWIKFQIFSNRYPKLYVGTQGRDTSFE